MPTPIRAWSYELLHGVNNSLGGVFYPEVSDFRLSLKLIPLFFRECCEPGVALEDELLRRDLVTVLVDERDLDVRIITRTANDGLDAGQAVCHGFHDLHEVTVWCEVQVLDLFRLLIRVDRDDLDALDLDAISASRSFNVSVVLQYYAAAHVVASWLVLR